MMRALRIHNRANGGLAVAIAGLLCACPGKADDPIPQVDPKAQAAADTQALVKRANTEAFERLLPLATAAFEAEAPLRSSSDELAPRLRVPPVSPTQRASLRKAMEAALKEDDGIRPELLEPKQEALLHAIRFGLNRIRDGLARRQPWRTDPSWVVGHAAAVVDRVRELRATGACDACSAAMGQLAKDITAATAGLSACSPAAARAARAGLRDLERAIGALSDEADRSQATAAVTAAATRMQAVAQAVEAATEGGASYDKPGAPPKAAAGTRRLPTALGPDELRRRLEVEENLSTPPGALYRSLGPTLAQLQKLAQRSEGSAAAPQTPVDLARCELHHAKLKTFASAGKGRPPVALSCAQIQHKLPVSGTDADLLLAIVDYAMIDPYRADRRAAEGPVLGALFGRVTPHSGRHTFRLGIAMSYGDDATVKRSARDAWDATCAAAAALWVHGELGTEGELRTQLASRCAQHPAEHWIALARGNPRVALVGLGVGWLTRGPASVVLLERLWWLPLGLIGELSDPSLLRQPETPVKIEVEPVKPAPRPPPGSQGPQ